MVDNEAGHFFNFRKNKKTDKQKTEAVAKAGRRRSYFLAVMSLVLAGILIYRLHWLQISRAVSAGPSLTAASGARSMIPREEYWLRLSPPTILR